MNQETVTIEWDERELEFNVEFSYTPGEYCIEKAYLVFDAFEKPVECYSVLQPEIVDLIEKALEDIRLDNMAESKINRAEDKAQRQLDRF